MDKRLEKALEFANFNVTLNNQKRILKEKYKEDPIFYPCGLKFTVDAIQLICVHSMFDSTQDPLFYR